MVKITPCPKPVKAKKVKKVKKVSERKKLDKDCLDLWSDCVIARDKTCRNCNSDERLSGHHIRVKQHQATRYNFEVNGLCLCWRCHSLQKFQPEKFNDMIIDIIGQEKYDQAKRLSQPSWKWSLDDLRQIKIHLKRCLNDLNG